MAPRQQLCDETAAHKTAAAGDKNMPRANALAHSESAARIWRPGESMPASRCGQADDVGDRSNHGLGIDKANCTWPKPMEIAGGRAEYG